METYPDIDYVWLWLNEHSFMGVNIEKALENASFAEAYNAGQGYFKEAADDAARFVGVWALEYMKLTSDYLRSKGSHAKVILGGWGGGHQLPSLLKGLDRALPKDIIFSCLNPDLGKSPQPEFLSDIAKNRTVWAVPWLEGDHQLWHFQPRVEMMRDHVKLAAKQNLDGVIAIHWRTEEPRFNFRTFAHFASNKTDNKTVEQLYEEYLTEDMGQTAQYLVSDLMGLLPFAQGLDLTPEVGRILNSKKVSDHHAIIPTSEFVKQGFTGLAESECKLMNLVCSKLLCAVAAPHEYETVTAVFSCAGNEFTAKGKTVLVPGWKEIDQRFRSTLKADTEEEVRNTLPELAEGQSFSVMANVSEHFTSPPKAYTEDTLLSAMERAGAEDMPEDKVNCSAGAREGGLGHAERKGLGTPATRAAILEKLVQMGFVQRKGKQLVPTKDGINLAVVLPESLTSPALTAEWENRLTEIAKGSADPDEFMAEIETQVRQLVKTYSCISADKQNLFQSKRVIIGKCPRCNENVYEGKKNFYCGNRSCQFVMWKNDRFFEQRKKAFTPKIAAALLKDGKAKVKGLYSEKTGKIYDATVLLADTGGKYVNYRVERKG